MIICIYNVYTKAQYVHVHKFVYKKSRRIDMWTKPAATEMRFGFEVTMYVMNK